MRKAEEIILDHYGCTSLEELCNYLGKEDISVKMLVECIRIAQEDAIRATVKECADKARTCKEALLKERSYLVNDLDLMKNSFGLYVGRSGYMNFSNITSSTFCKNVIINAIEVRISEIDKTLGI